MPARLGPQLSHPGKQLSEGYTKNSPALGTLTCKVVSKTTSFELVGTMS